jgi:hypothetical protein
MRGLQWTWQGVIWKKRGMTEQHIFEEQTDWPHRYALEEVHFQL